MVQSRTSWHDVALTFGVNKSTIIRLVTRYRETGDVKDRANNEVTARAAFRAGGSSSIARCVVLVADGDGRSGDELDPSPGSRPRLAADRASVQARLVKSDSSIMNGPRREPCKTQSPNTH